MSEALRTVPYMKEQWPHYEMKIVGRTPEGYRIARTFYGKEILLAPGMPALGFFYNDSTRAELSRDIEKMERLHR